MPTRLTKMLQRVKRSDLDMVAYFVRKTGLISACNFKGRDAVECMAHGIKDNVIQVGIRAANFSSLVVLCFLISIP